MTRRGLHLLLATILLVCVVVPHIEVAFDWNQCVLITGYDSESTVGVVALLLVLALALARLLAIFLPAVLIIGRDIASPMLLRPMHNSVLILPEASPPLPLRI